MQSDLTRVKCDSRRSFKVVAAVDGLGYPYRGVLSRYWRHWYSLGYRILPQLRLPQSLIPALVELSEGFSRDVTNIGRFGTGDGELRVELESPWSVVEDLTRRAYLAN